MNPAIEAQSGSVIRALNAKRKPSSINLGIGEPTLRPDRALFESAMAWVDENGCGYSSNAGFDDLREAIASHYAYPSLDRAANVCTTTGSQEAVYVALKTLCDPACDEVLIVDPAFSIYHKICEVEGIPFARVRMPASTGFAFDAAAILEAITPRTRVVVICSPNNPTGRTISRSEAQAISSALLARGGLPIYVLHDEIYRELSYIDDVGTFGEIYPYTIAINSLSKSHALTGLRIGWAIGPADVMPQIVKMHGWATSCASTFAQRVAMAAFASGDLSGHLAWYAHQREGVLAAAAEFGLDHVVPDGAFYLCIRTGADDTLAFAERLLVERDVVAIPAHIFSEDLRGWLRTSFVSPLESVREGYRRIAAEMREHGLVAGAAG
jgi:aspartate/methionine/tyrosine aminotransferase